MPVDQSTRLWSPTGQREMKAELVDLETKENVEETEADLMHAEGLHQLKPSESAANQLRQLSKRRQEPAASVEETMVDLGPIEAEAGDGSGVILALDAPPFPKAQPVQADVHQEQFAERPALQLRNFRSLGGNGLVKHGHGSGQAERAAREEPSNVILPGSVPAAAPQEGFDLATAAGEDHHGEEEERRSQASANHMDDLGPVEAQAGIGSMASDTANLPPTQTLQVDVRQQQGAARPALQLRNFRSLGGNPVCKDGVAQGERAAREEPSNVFLPGSVPAAAPQEGFDLATAAEGEDRHGEEEERMSQASANHMDDLGPVEAEAGNGSGDILALDAPGFPKAQPVQADVHQEQFAERPALQLRNFRSLGGDALVKHGHGSGQAERAAREEPSNVILPGSVPAAAPQEGLDLATAAGEDHHGEEEERRSQASANHMDDLGPVEAQAGIGSMASDTANLPPTQTLQVDVRQQQGAARPALQLRNFRSLGGNPVCKDRVARGERAAREEPSNVFLPGSVPAAAPQEGFDLATAAGEDHHGEEEERRSQASANHMDDLGPVEAEAGNGSCDILALDAPPFPKAQPVQADVHQENFAERPALQLPCLRSLRGNPVCKDRVPQGERAARQGPSNVFLPGSVPAAAPQEGFDLATAAEGEDHHGEEEERRSQASANHMDDLGPVEAEAGNGSGVILALDAPPFPKAQPVQADVHQEQFAERPALQLRNLRFRQSRSVSPKFRRETHDGRGTSQSPPGLSRDRTRPFTERAGSMSGASVAEAEQEETGHGQLSPASNLRDLRSTMALHQQRKEELEKCVANFAQSDQFHECIMQTEQAHALLQQLLPQGKADSPKRPYLLSVALKRAGEPEPAMKLDSLASEGSRPSMP